MLAKDTDGFYKLFSQSESKASLATFCSFSFGFPNFIGNQRTQKHTSSLLAPFCWHFKLASR